MSDMGTTGRQRTPVQHEMDTRLADARTRLAAEVAAMPADPDVLPADLSWAEYAVLVAND